MEKRITRVVNSYKVTALAADLNTNVIESVELLVPTMAEKKIAPYVANIINTEYGLDFIKVSNVETVEELYWMTETDFVNHATKSTPEELAKRNEYKSKRLEKAVSCHD